MLNQQQNCFRLLAAGWLVLLSLTCPLWLPDTEFPQVPLFRSLINAPAFVSWGLIVLQVMGLVSMAVARPVVVQKLACGISVVCCLTLVCLNQHRFQAWAWQFMLIGFILATARATTAIVLWRWLVIGIYAWSGLSKLDSEFGSQHGQFLLEGLLKSVHQAHLLQFWSPGFRHTIAAAFPILEFLIAAGLVWRGTRRIAVYGAALMHLCLFLSLGPLGHNHQPGVLFWNLFFVAQNALVFRRNSVERDVSRDHEDHALSRACHPAESYPDNKSITSAAQPIQIGDLLAKCVVGAALLWPAFESWGYCDHWPAWALYAAKPERVTVFVHESELSKLPDKWKIYLPAQTVIDDWHPFRIDRWSLASAYAPIYPQDRFQIGVALGLAKACDLKQLRIIVEGPAARWSGKRVVREYVGLDGVETLADSFRFNARPR